MITKDFLSKSSVAVIGAGAWGTVLANLAAQNAGSVKIWTREEDAVKAINGTRCNTKYVSQLHLSPRIQAYTEIQRVLDGSCDVIIWALPSSACREQAQVLSKFFKGHEIVIHATKGIEPITMKRISTMLGEELPTRRIGMLSGPNLAHEIARGEPAATVVASVFEEVQNAGQLLFSSAGFRVYTHSDIVGVEWAGTLKNILALASGTVDALKLGWNTRATLITRGLAEMIRFGEAMGGSVNSFLGLAGIGDLLATASSPLSRNFRVGHGLASGKTLNQVLQELGGVAEGVKTTQSVNEYAKRHQIYMPITDGVCRMLFEDLKPQDLMRDLMGRPQMKEGI